MNASLLRFTVFLFLACGLFLQAQTNITTNSAPPNPQIARELRMISFLTPAEQEQYAKARAKALADNPDLKTEGENLLKQGQALMPDGAATDQQKVNYEDARNFMEKMMIHRQKLRQAMLKVDPTLEPIFAQIDKHISEMKAKQLGQAQGTSSATNAASAQPSANP